MYSLIIIFISIILFTNGLKAKQCEEEETPSYKTCQRRIHRECNFDTSYTEQELENARLWLIERMRYVNPSGIPCAKLSVRKDWKCMSDSDRKEILRIFKILEANGFMAKITEDHAVHWPQNHKFFVGFLNHRAFMNELGNEIKKINPNMDLPYWNLYTEWKDAHKSIFWDYFGTAGDKENGFCVLDGLLPNLTILYPQTHCLPREWPVRHGKKVLDWWEPPEWVTAFVQMGNIAKLNILPIMGLVQFAPNAAVLQNRLELLMDILSSDEQLWGQLIPASAYLAHFKTHLMCGGWAGDMSVPLATNDPTFFPFHEGVHLDFLKWQLRDKRNLAPRSFNLGLSFDWDKQSIFVADIDKDNLLPYKNISIRQSLQVGYGDYCYIHDQLIKPINDIINKKKPKLPVAIQRLKDCLSPEKFERYYPKFALCPDELNYFDYEFPDVGNCNAKPSNGTCRPLLIAKRFTQLGANGLRQWERFRYDPNTKADLTGVISAHQDYYEELMRDLIACGYCSPYA